MVLSHFIGFQPNTHRIVGTQHHGITYTRYTLYFRNYVDLGVVLKKFVVIFVVRTIEGEYQQHTGLAFGSDDAYFGYFGR